jgi:hypothetical protein
MSFSYTPQLDSLNYLVFFFSFVSSTLTSCLCRFGKIASAPGLWLLFFFYVFRLLEGVWRGSDMDSVQLAKKKGKEIYRFLFLRKESSEALFFARTLFLSELYWSIRSLFVLLF